MATLTRSTSWATALLEIGELATSESVALADGARTRARGHSGMQAMALKLERVLVEAADMGQVSAPAVLWFGSIILVSLSAYVMATIYASTHHQGIRGRKSWPRSGDR
jgi:hypothetical protein